MEWKDKIWFNPYTVRDMFKWLRQIGEKEICEGEILVFSRKRLISLDQDQVSEVGEIARDWAEKDQRTVS